MQNELDIFTIIEMEKERQNRQIELIASENFVSKDVLKAQGSILTNKYAEGYPGARYYEGCEYVDLIEQRAINALKDLFNVRYANVQPHSGSQANAAAYQAIMPNGGKILALSLNDGGHLTHGHHLNFSGLKYETAFYGLDNEGFIDYDDVREKALEFKPDVIVAGASAYSRIIHFDEFYHIAQEVGAYLMADIAHIAGLIVAGLHPSPAGYADIITSTTHKTLRGPRGGVIMTNNYDLHKKIRTSVFPGSQGGPLMHVIAAKAVAFEEALKPEFKKYQRKVVKNNRKMFKTLMKKGAKIVSDGSDNHLFILDTVTSYNLTGKEASSRLHKIGITCNKNTIPNDKNSPMVTSGVRIGTAAITTRGAGGRFSERVANIINKTLLMNHEEFDNKLEKLSKEVYSLASKLKKIEGL